MKKPVIKVSIRIKEIYSIRQKVEVKQVGTDSYMLIESPLSSCRYNYGTVVQAVPNKKGELIFVRLVKGSNYKTRQFVLNDNTFSQRIGYPIIVAGGAWEVRGGSLYIHTLKNSSFDLDLFFKENNFNPIEFIDPYE